MPFEQWQIKVLQDKGLADAQGDIVFEMLKHVDNPDTLTHAVVRKPTDKYEFYSKSGWSLDKKLAAVMPKEKADKLAAKLAREGAKSVVFTEKVNPEVIQRLFASDQTPDHRWSDWIFEQAGGGAEGRKQSERHFNYLQQRFVHQYDPETWATTEAAFREQLRSGDEDVLFKMRGCFGYRREWPGRDNVYQHVTDAVALYQQQEGSLAEMNQEEGAEAVPVSPEQIPDLNALNGVNRKVSNWIQAKRVRTDYRVATWKKEKTIYDDDYITAIAPLTYAAAVKYGFQNWDVANPEKFAKVSRGELQGNPWDNFVAHGNFMVFLQFNVPMPRWIGRDKGGYPTYELSNLLLALDADTAKANPDEWSVMDEENNKTLTIAQVKEIIMREAKAEPPPPPAPAPANQGWQRREDPHPLRDPAYMAKAKDWPIKRGGQSVGNEQEAQNIVQHLDACLREVQAWASKFDPTKVARVVER